MTDTRWTEIPAEVGEDLWRTLSKRMGEGCRTSSPMGAACAPPPLDILKLEDYGTLPGHPTATTVLGDANRTPLIKRESRGVWEGHSIKWKKRSYFVPDGRI